MAHIFTIEITAGATAEDLNRELMPHKKDLVIRKEQDAKPNVSADQGRILTGLLILQHFFQHIIQNKFFYTFYVLDLTSQILQKPHKRFSKLLLRYYVHWWPKVISPNESNHWSTDSVLQILCLEDLLFLSINVKLDSKLLRHRQFPTAWPSTKLCNPRGK